MKKLFVIAMVAVGLSFTYAQDQAADSGQPAQPEKVAKCKDCKCEGDCKCAEGKECTKKEGKKCTKKEGKKCKKAGCKDKAAA